ncbi:MAG: hypothetical protein ACD_79C01384G0001, partial [uncultured bacterium]
MEAVSSKIGFAENYHATKVVNLFSDTADKQNSKGISTLEGSKVIDVRGFVEREITTYTGGVSLESIKDFVKEEKNAFGSESEVFKQIVELAESRKQSENGNYAKAEKLKTELYESRYAYETPKFAEMVEQIVRFEAQGDKAVGIAGKLAERVSLMSESKDAGTKNQLAVDFNRTYKEVSQIGTGKVFDEAVFENNLLFAGDKQAQSLLGQNNLKEFINISGDLKGLILETSKASNSLDLISKELSSCDWNMKDIKGADATSRIEELKGGYEAYVNNAGNFESNIAVAESLNVVEAIKAKVGYDKFVGKTDAEVAIIINEYFNQQKQYADKQTVVGDVLEWVGSSAAVTGLLTAGSGAWSLIGGGAAAAGATLSAPALLAIGAIAVVVGATYYGMGMLINLNAAEKIQKVSYFTVSEMTNLLIAQRSLIELYNSKNGTESINSLVGTVGRIFQKESLRNEMYALGIINDQGNITRSDTGILGKMLGISNAQGDALNSQLNQLNSIDINSPNFSNSLDSLKSDFKSLKKDVNEVQMWNEGFKMIADVVITAGFTVGFQALKYSRFGLKYLATGAEKEFLIEGTKSVLERASVSKEIIEQITNGIRTGEHSLASGLKTFAKDTQLLKYGNKLLKDSTGLANKISSRFDDILSLGRDIPALRAVRVEIFKEANTILAGNISTKLMGKLSFEGAEKLTFVQSKVLSLGEGLFNLAQYRGSLGQTLFGNGAMAEQLLKSGVGLFELGAFTSFAFTPLVTTVKTLTNNSWTENLGDALLYNISKDVSEGWEQYNSGAKIFSAFASSLNTGMTFAYVTPMMHWNPNNLSNGLFKDFIQARQAILGGEVASSYMGRIASANLLGKTYMLMEFDAIKLVLTPAIEPVVKSMANVLQLTGQNKEDFVSKMTQSMTLYATLMFLPAQIKDQAVNFNNIETEIKLLKDNNKITDDTYVNVKFSDNITSKVKAGDVLNAISEARPEAYEGRIYQLVKVANGEDVAEISKLANVDSKQIEFAKTQQSEAIKVLSEIVSATGVDVKAGITETQKTTEGITQPGEVTQGQKLSEAQAKAEGPKSYSLQEIEQIIRGAEPAVRKAAIALKVIDSIKTSGVSQSNGINDWSNRKEIKSNVDALRSSEEIITNLSKTISGIKTLETEKQEVERQSALQGDSQEYKANEKIKEIDTKLNELNTKLQTEFGKLTLTTEKSGTAIAKFESIEQLELENIFKSISNIYESNTQVEAMLRNEAGYIRVLESKVKENIFLKVNSYRGVISADVKAISERFSDYISSVKERAVNSSIEIVGRTDTEMRRSVETLIEKRQVEKNPEELSSTEEAIEVLSKFSASMTEGLAREFNTLKTEEK